MKKISTILLFFIFIITNKCSAQQTFVGLELGLGNTVFNTIGLFEIPSTDYDNYLNVGATFDHVPKNALFRYKSGLIFKQQANNNGSLQYIHIPLGIDIISKGKLYGFIGAGGYSSYLLMDNGFEDHFYIEDKILFKETIKKFQLGGYIDLGIGYKFIDRWSLELFYQKGSDLTKLFDDYGHTNYFSLEIHPIGTVFQLIGITVKKDLQFN